MHSGGGSGGGGGGSGGEDEQLWFVAQGLARRKAREEAVTARKQQQQEEQSTREKAGPEQQAAGAAPWPPPPAEWSHAAARQALQLAAGLTGLILLPAALTPGALASPRPWLLFAAYFTFFFGGSVRRVLRHGPLAPRASDAQRAGAGGRAALAAFIAAMPLIHWLPLMRHHGALAALPPDAAAAHGGLALYDLLGAALIAGAIKLNWSAAAALGAAYDRVVAPPRLVTEGPYALVQHPIYGSYMLLFAGYCLACHSAPFALLAAWACGLYYTRRAGLERDVLRAAFGGAYDDYALRTPRRFIPWVV
ncbi:MAG: hypothetical protein J3K34DRAFT_527857 [Monoraphidium minutum]|nr:MAG: hypothetical protein J3K34DRAFT_527857 [Monoraphidium minutum]